MHVAKCIQQNNEKRKSMGFKVDVAYCASNLIVAVDGIATRHLWPNVVSVILAVSGRSSERVNHNTVFCIFGLNQIITRNHPTKYLIFPRTHINKPKFTWMCPPNEIFLIRGQQCMYCSMYPYIHELIAMSLEFPSFSVGSCGREYRILLTCGLFISLGYISIKNMSLWFCAIKQIWHYILTRLSLKTHSIKW